MAAGRAGVGVQVEARIPVEDLTGVQMRGLEIGAKLARIDRRQLLKKQMAVVAGDLVGLFEPGG
ncbi:MAG: hypothetical protein U1E24_16080 [Phenylobacterium sp.]|nr:hypothetical protein [Phenylobacterium sp.]